MPDQISIYEFMEDFDNEELSSYDRVAQLEHAVVQYNQEYLTNYKPVSAVSNYESWKRDKNKPDM